MKSFILVVFLLSNSAMALSRKHPAPSPTPAPTASPVPSATPSPTPNSNPSAKLFNVKCDKSCTASELADMPKIEALMNSTIASECFEKYFSGRKRIDMAQGYSGAAIVKILRKPMDLTVNYYNDSNTVVDGYESSSDYSTIHFNRVALKANGFNLCDKASLGAHEMTHAKGFFHNGNKANPNYYTVPYTANHAFDSGDSDYGACCKM